MPTTTSLQNAPSSIATTIIALALTILALCAAPLAASTPELRTLDPTLFPVPETLEPNIDFWTTVYTGYDSNHILIHDDLHLKVVYAVVDFTAVNVSPTISEYQKARQRRDELKRVKEKYETLLRHLAAGRRPAEHADELARIELLFAEVPGDASKFSAAADRLRTQTCLKDRFEQAIHDSGRFMPEIERIFDAHALPRPLTRLPFVESMFQLNAHSSAAAAGIWQFVRPTAQLYLDMELEFDERFDPFRATEAAAKLLSKNHAELGNWPLAVTAYNHGLNGMKRAVAQLGTKDLGEINAKYRSRIFGFASRNFYAELIAAAEIYDNRAHYFPNAQPDAPWQFEEIQLDDYVSVRDLASKAGLDPDILKMFNPAVSTQVWSGNLFLPKGYRLRVPAARGDAARLAYAELPSDARSPHQVGLYYRVQTGDTLGKIAARFGTSVLAVQHANGLRSPHLIRRGQQLLIPPRGGSGGGPVLLATGNGEPRRHIVRRGDTLGKIATRYRTSVRAIQSANRLRGDVIRPNQVLIIP